MKFLSHDGLMYFWTSVKNYIDTKYNELFTSVSNGKSLVASAITDKGVATDATATFATMADNIDQISTGVETYDATAVETDVLSGKTYYKDNLKKTGTMVRLTDVASGSSEVDANGNPVRRLNVSDIINTTEVFNTTTNATVGHVFDINATQNGYLTRGTPVKVMLSGVLPQNIKVGQKIGNPNAEGAYITGTYTSDANATAAQILNGNTAYVNGSKVTGTMANRVSSITASTPTLDTTNSRVSLKIPNNGYYDTNASVYSTYANMASAIGLTANKLVSGNTVLGIDGTGSSDVLNFPLSIQDAQPTGVRNGHIWIKSSTLASQITSASIQESLNAGVANNSLQFVVGETSMSYLSLRNSTKRLTSGGNNINTASTQSNGGSQDWLVTSVSNVIEYKLNRPMVYSKVNNVLDIETAYMWNGSSWVLLSQKGNYVLIGAQDGIDVYNKTGDSLVAGQLISQTGDTSENGSNPVSKDGRIIIHGLYVYKRIGDVYSLYHTFPINTYVLERGVSGDGSRIIEVVKTIISGTAYYYVVCYVDNGSGFVKESQSDNSYAVAGDWNWNTRMVINTTGTFVAFTIPTNSTTSGIYNIAYYFRNGTTWTTDGKKTEYTHMSSAGQEKIVLSYDETKLIVPYENNNNRYIRSYTINFTSNTITLLATSQSFSSYYTLIGGISTGHVLLYGGAYRLFNPNTGEITDFATGQSIVSAYFAGITIAGDRLFAVNPSRQWALYQMNVSTRTLTLISQGTARLTNTPKFATIIPF